MLLSSGGGGGDAAAARCCAKAMHLGRDDSHGLCLACDVLQSLGRHLDGRHATSQVGGEEDNYRYSVFSSCTNGSNQSNQDNNLLDHGIITWYLH